jgi:hypothetical protein
MVPNHVAAATNRALCSLKKQIFKKLQANLVRGHSLGGVGIGNWFFSQD